MSEVQSLWRGIVQRPAGGWGVSVRPEVRDAVVALVACKRGVAPADILSKSRRQHITQARQEVMWRLRAIRGAGGRPKHSYPLIARSLGLGDHTTVIHGVRAHERRLLEQGERV